MAALLRLLIVALVGLTIIYVALLFWARSAQRAKLAAQWETDPRGDRDTFIAEGLAAQEAPLRRKLILGVYVAPTVFVAIILYLNNFA